MRLGRPVLAGLVAGAVAGFVVALLRPRSTRPATLGYRGPTVEDGAGTNDLLSAAGDDLPIVEPVIAPGKATWEPAASVPGASRLTDPRDRSGTVS